VRNHATTPPYHVQLTRRASERASEATVSLLRTHARTRRTSTPTHAHAHATHTHTPSAAQPGSERASGPVRGVRTAVRVGREGRRRGLRAVGTGLMGGDFVGLGVGEGRRKEGRGSSLRCVWEEARAWMDGIDGTGWDVRGMCVGDREKGRARRGKGMDGGWSMARRTLFLGYRY
jgi:hypothetical protein